MSPLPAVASERYYVSRLYVRPSVKTYYVRRDNCGLISMELGTERPEIACSLRSRKHFKSLIDKTTDLSDRHVLIRALYKDCFLDFNFDCVHMTCLHLP